MINLLEVNQDITLSRLSYSDTTPIFSLIDKHRENLRNWLPFVDFTIKPSDTEAFIGSLFMPHSREMVFTIRYKEEVAGLIGYKDIDRHNRKLEIGYWLAPPFVGNGIITQSLKVLIDKAFDQLEMNRIQIRCAVGNLRSSNVPRRLNFTFEGIERHGENLNNRFVDLEIFGLLRSEWKNETL